MDGVATRIAAVTDGFEAGWPSAPRQNGRYGIGAVV